jgi:hypothetical protein
MKKHFYVILGIISIISITRVSAQKVLVTDDASFSTPNTLLQVHKTGTNGDLLQVTTGNTGTSSTDGFKVNLQSDNTVNLNNQENSSMKFFTNGTSRMIIDASGNVQMTGLLAYNFIHGACYIENASYAPSVTQNVYTQITPGMTLTEADGLTISGDQVTIGTTGHYKVDIVITLTSASASDDFRVKMYKNGSTTGVPGSNHISPGGSGQYCVLSYFWYLPLTASDVLSFWITNTQSNNDPTISDMKVYLEKKPE